jgi:hypothetical protein
MVKTIGFLATEKVQEFHWSGAGDIFTIIENEGGKTSLNFYMIS